MELIVTRADGAISVSPAAPYLTQYLEYYHRGFKLVNYRRVNDFEKRMLHQVLADGTLITFPGFFAKICELCRENNDTITVVDNRTPLPPVDWEAIRGINWAGIGSSGLRDYQFDSIAEFLVKAQSTSGIVNATGGYGKTIVQAITYAAFNSLNTILAIPLKEVFFQTYENFCKLLPDKHIGRVGGGFHEISSDITITTFKSLSSCSTEKCKLLLIDELQCTTGEEISSILCKMAPVRIFGYTATDEGFFNKAEKLVRGLFGDRLIYIPYQEAEEANAVVPCTVYFVRLPDDLFINASTIEAKFNKGIKTNLVRNKLIASVCCSVPDGWQTLVFVDHIEDHLVSLHKCMPIGTRYLHRGTSKKEFGNVALSPSQQKATIAEYKNGKFQFLIATDAFRSGVDIPNLRVVVQSSGGTSEVELLQEAYRGSRTAPGKTHFVLIDFVDNHDLTLENMSKRRREIYKKQGWKIRDVAQIKDIDWYCTEKKGNCDSARKIT